MTIPRERANSLTNTREFLKSLLDPKKTPRVPKEVRREAYYCLKHFPSDYEVELTQKKVPEIWGGLED